MKRSPLRKVNRKRKKKREREGEVYGPFWRFVKTLPCLVGGDCWGGVTGHHLKSVGSGGIDSDGTVPLCEKHHTEIHTSGAWRFQTKYAVDVRMVADELWRRYCEGFQTD